ncbi:MAG: PAS domain S-box protein [Methanospirillum sp.]
MAGEIRVLYVDDEPGLLELGRLFLARSGGLRVDTASSALEALDSPAILSYDVIVSDYQMPDMDGIAFLKAIRERFGDIPFILFTGKGREEVVIDAINNGADFYIQKGGDPRAQFAELAHKVRQAMRRKQAERSLQDSERRLSDIIDFLPDATFAIDSNGEVIAWNRAIEEMTGVPPCEMLGRGDRAYTVPFYGSKRAALIDLLDEPEDEVSRLYSNVNRTSTVLSGETDLPCPRGRQIAVLAKACHLYNREGEIVGGIESIRDITARNRLERDLEEKHRELRASYEELAAAKERLRIHFDELARSERERRIDEERLIMAQEIGHIGSWEYTVGSDEAWRSAECLRLFGIPGPAGCVRLERLLACIPEGGQVHRALLDLIAGTGEYNLEYSVCPEDGTAPRVVHSVGRLERDANGRPARVVGVIQDITERKRADAALQRVSTELQQIFGNMISALIVWESVFDEAGRFVSCRFGKFNDAFARTTGVRGEEVQGKDIFEVWPGAARAWVDEIRHVAATGDPRVFDIHHGPTNGWFHCNAYRPTDSPSLVCVIFEDITEQRRIEEETAFKNTILLTQQETSLDGILIVGATGRVHHYNRQFVDLWGIPEELIATCDDSRMLEYATGQLADPEAFIAHVRHLYRHTDEKSFEELLLRDGRTFEVFSAPMVGEGGRYYGRVLYFRDISVRRRMERTLQESESFLTSVIEQSPNPIWIVDAAGTMVRMNRACRELLQVKDDDRVGTYNIFEDSVIEEQGLMPLVRRVFDVGEPADFSLVYDTPNLAGFSPIHTASRVLAATIFPIKDLEGRVTHAVVQANDITEWRRANDALQESEEKYRELADLLPQTVYELDLDLRVTYANQNAIAELGFGRTGIEPGVDALSFVDPSQHAQVKASVLAFLNGTPFEPAEYTIVRHDGGTFPAIVYPGPIYRDGVLAGFRGVIVDISARKRAEDALRESELRFRSLIQNSSDMTRILDREGRIAYSSPSTLRLFGYDPADLIGKDPLAYVHPDDRERVKSVLDAVFARTSPGTPAEFRLRHADGRYIEVETIATNLTDTPGVDGIVTTTRPIAERMRTAERLRESEEKFRTTFDNSPNPIAINRVPDLAFLDVNPAFLGASGYAKEEVIGRSPAELGMLSPADGAMLAEHRARTGRIETVPLTLTVKGGRQIHVLFSSLPVTIGAEPALVTVTADVTGLRRAEEELLRKNNELAAANAELTATTEQLRLRYEELSGKEEAIRASEEQFRTLVELSLDGIVIADFTGTLLFANREAARIVGIPEYPSEYGTMNVMEFVAPESREEVVRDLGRISQGGEARLVRYGFVTVTGRPVWVECIGKKIPYRETEAVLISMRDVTERTLAEERARDSELRFSSVFRHSPVALTLASAADGTFVDINDSFVRNTGYSRDEMIGRTAKAVDFFVSRDEYGAYVSAIRQKGMAHGLEMKCRSRSGEIRTCLFFSGIIPIGGRPYILSTVEDVTERRATESALQAIVASMVGTTGLDALRTMTGTVSAWLEADCAMIGESRQNGRTIDILAMRLDGEEMTGGSFPMEGTPCGTVAEKGFTLYPDDVCGHFPGVGQLVEQRFRGYVGTPLRNAGGDVVGVICALSRSVLSPPPNAREILETIAVKAAAEIERIRTERAVRDSRQVLGKAMDLADLANWELDLETGVFSFDERFYALYGTMAEREGGNRMTAEAYLEEFVYPDDRDAVAAAIHDTRAATDPGYTAQLEHRIVRRDGELRYMAVRLGVKEYADGRVTRVYGATQDITARRLVEDALQQANRKLGLLSDITRHDIKNQLVTLDGFLELLRLELPGNAHADYFSRIETASATIASLIAFAREYELIGVQAPVWQDVRAVVDDAGRDVVLGETRLVNDLPADSEVFADPLIAKVFFNLIDNAVRHAGPISTIRFSAEEREGGVVIVCEDDGDGISVGEKPLLFNPGYGKNTGFGLALSRKILEITGIAITENGEPGRGARFEMTVPAAGWRSLVEIGGTDSSGEPCRDLDESLDTGSPA